MAVGLLLEGVQPRRYLRESVFSFAFRSTAYPLLFLGMAVVAVLNHLDTSVLVLFGLVPSALFSSLIADFFGLDTALATAVFVTSTVLFVLLVLPLYVLALAVI